MKSFIQKMLVMGGIATLFALPVLSFSQAAYADDLLNGATSDACSGVGLGDGSVCNNQTNTDSVNSILKAVIDTLSFIIGIVSVIVIIVQGFRFITSGGDPNSISSARNAIMYAVVGIVIAGAAQLIVHYVIEKGA